MIAHLVSQQLKNGLKPVDAVRAALPRLKGAFALAFLFEGYDDLLIGARKGSPLAVGYGHGEMYLGSDSIALAPLTDMISYLEDGDITVITREGIDFIEYERRLFGALARKNLPIGRRGQRRATGISCTRKSLSNRRSPENPCELHQRRCRGHKNS